MENEKQKPKKGNHSSVGKIDKVEESKEFHKSSTSKWGPIIKAVNPFGAMAESYAKTLAYKIETKRLDVELKRIKEQAKIANNMIDKSFRLKLEELNNRRIELVSFYNTVNVELQRLHIERIEVLGMAKRAQEMAFTKDISPDERNMYKDMAIEMTKQLPSFGDKSNESLQKLVQALPPVEISPKLLEG